MAVKKAAAKKAVKKAAAPAKKATTEVESSPLEGLAREVMSGKWNSGRERDILLREAGHDPRAIEKEVARLRSQT